MEKYTRDLNKFLGPESSMSKFDALESGDYVDFIPDTWQMAHDAELAKQKRLMKIYGAKGSKSSMTAAAMQRKQQARKKAA